jgi:hypothetical protein
LSVNEQMTEQTSSEPGSLNAGSAVPNSLNVPSEPVAALARLSTPETTDVDSSKLAPEQGAADETPKADAPKAEPEAPKAEALKAEALKAEAPKADIPKVDAPRVDAPRIPGTVMTMSAGDRAGPAPEVEQGSGMFGKRRLAALAAVVALAAAVGALGGAVATAGLGHYPGDGATTAENSALEATVARIDADIAALKASVEHAAKANTAQFSKTSDRLDKVEKGQAEPAAKLAKLSEAVDKLRVAPVAPVAAAAAPAAAKEVTGSISPAATATPAAAAAAAKPEMARLPTLDGWVLRDVANGMALIEGRRGMFEVYAGDPIPGLGRVDAIRRQDGRWVVVTGKGLIVAR